MPHNEDLSRIKINSLLEEAGWQFFDTAEGKDNILQKNHAKIMQKVADTCGNDFDKTAAVDYKSIAESHTFFNYHF